VRYARPPWNPPKLEALLQCWKVLCGSGSNRRETRRWENQSPLSKDLQIDRVEQLLRLRRGCTGYFQTCSSAERPSALGNSSAKTCRLP